MGIIDKAKSFLIKDRSATEKALEIKQSDVSEDLPSTVIPLTADDRHAAEMRGHFSGQDWSKQAETTDKIYVWRKANEYMEQWLLDNSYYVIESQVFDDCIGYRCNRKGYSYAVFMYAYGEEKTAMLDGEHCSKLKALPFAENSTVLVLYLKVDRVIKDNSIEYKVGHYANANSIPEPWRLSEYNGKPILEYYPRKEMCDQTWRFMYAFNREDTDIYDCIIADKNPSIEGMPDVDGIAYNDGFYMTLQRLHQEYGNMKMGYVRVNDVVYCLVPYIENLGFFSWSVYIDSERISNVAIYPFDGGKLKIEEFIGTDMCEPDDLFDFIPKLTKAVPLPSAPTERFAVKLFFDNGECKKYVLPINADEENAEVVSYRNHVFTEGIWTSVSVVPSHESRYKGYPECGPAIKFKNGFHIAGTRCYLEGKPYSEPKLTDEIVYSDEKYQVRKIWEWDANALYEDGETGLIHVLLNGQAFNYDGVSTYASVDGNRVTSLSFDYSDSFHEGLACVYIDGHGFGYIDKNMQLVISAKYDEAEDFHDGKAKVRLRDRWLYIDKDGNELELGGSFDESKYQEVGRYWEEMCKVSTRKLRFMDLAYYSDHQAIAGIWGYVNEAGEEVIAPQYIYAGDFVDGIAFVAKGKWTIDPKWDNEYNQGLYWTEEEWWGAIDKNGNEVIPFIFDEIDTFMDCTEVYKAHFGGWENGHWGVIDRQGNWLVEPIFKEIDHEYSKGLFAFYAKDEHPDSSDDVPMGIYDINQKKVLFEPQFFDVSFRGDGDIEVEVFDEQLGRRVEKIISRTGEERFKSVYTAIFTWKDPYEVMIRDNDGDRHGLIDKNGNVILPCIHDVPWNGIHHEHRRIIFIENEKQGMKDYDNNIIVPAIYHEIYVQQGPFFMVRVGQKNDYKEGLITPNGKSVIPANYKRVAWCKDNEHFFCCNEGHCEMYVVEINS